MPHPHPFRFGLNTFGSASLAEWTETIHKAEDQGWYSFTVADHTFSPFAPLAALAHAAAVSSTMRVGTYVLGNDFWHPTVTARELATVDMLSGGRLEIGLGTGWRSGDYSERGLQLDAPGVRIERLQEAVRLIKALWAAGEEPVTFEGKYYRTDNLISRPAPVQRPHPPFVLGGGGRRMLQYAAREAEIVSLNMRTTERGELDFASMTAEATAQKIEWIREAAGERFEQIELNHPVLLVAVTDNREEAAEQFLKGWGPLAAGATTADVLSSPHALVGSVEQIIDDLQMRREVFGLSYITKLGSLPQSPDFAKVVSRLAGT